MSSGTIATIAFVVVFGAIIPAGAGKNRATLRSMSNTVRLS